MSARQISLGVMLTLAVVIAACALAWNQYAYGDWTCAFTTCVRIKS